MSNKKKRTKAYTGKDAKVSTRTSVHHYTAVQRSQLGQWYYDRRLMIKRIAIYGGGGAIALVLIFEAIRSLFQI